MHETAAPADPDVHHLFIAGRWVESVSGATFGSENPSDTRDVVGRFQAGTAADVAMAITAADAALEGWKATPAPKRGELLYRFGCPHGGAQGAPCQGHDARDGQGAGRGPR